MKMKDWIKEIEKLDDEQKMMVSGAIQILKHWKVFEEEFKETGIFLIGMEIEYQKDLGFDKERMKP